MRAGHLARKTHLKKHAALPGELQIAMIDLTQEDVTIFSLAELYEDRSRDYDEIITLPYSFESEDDVLSWCASVLAESPTAKRLLEESAEQGWSVGMADLHSGGFYLDIPAKKLLVDRFSLAPAALGRSLYFRNAFLTIFIRALRDIWHEKRLETPFEEDYCPEDVLMLERVRAADCDTVTVLSCWELRGAGFSDVWRHLLGSEEGDMAMIFTRVLERDPAASFTGAALAYAFRQWYADQSRVDGCDHETLEILDDLLLGEDSQAAFGRRELAPLVVEKLSCLPDGTGYLKGMGPTILGDPFFAGLHDPINQTHLFHLIYDTEVTMVNNVPFRDGTLARRIFPGADNNHPVD